VRRILEAQGTEAGLIAPRYKNAVHALMLIRQEEGFRGLYRGFWIYSLLTSFQYWVVLNLFLSRKEVIII
jgi:hypothetical protein